MSYRIDRFITRKLRKMVPMLQHFRWSTDKAVFQAQAWDLQFLKPFIGDDTAVPNRRPRYFCFVVDAETLPLSLPPSFLGAQSPPFQTI
jgi:hypothetical protein